MGQIMRKLFTILIFSLCTVALANPTTDVWAPVASSVCTQINSALQAYRKGDIKQAQLTAIMAYFKGYDTDIEPAVRVTLGGPHVFAIEKQFHDYSTLMTPNPNPQQLKKVATAAAQLCQAVKSDANALSAAKVKRQVFNVE